MYDRRRATIGHAHDFKESVEMHRRIYRAIRSRRPEEARAAMHQHLLLAQRAFIQEAHDHPEISAPPAAG
jgi:GntR family transcriptional repressor for pyruvate dehydrogenase complex